MKIIYSPSFERSYKKFSDKTKILAEEKEKIFRKDPFDKRLKTHKLHGKLKTFWSFSVDNNFRIIFEFVEKDIVYFHLVGDHNIYYK